MHPYAVLSLHIALAFRQREIDDLKNAVVEMKQSAVSDQAQIQTVQK